MKKYLICILYSVSVAVLCPLRANVITGVAAIPEHYYDEVSGLSGVDNILNTLCTIIDDHTVIPYAGLEPYYEQTDFYADSLWDMYSTCHFTMADANKQQKAVCDGWNKEHVCCQSWLGSGPMVSDLFNVYPTDARVNNIRSNFPYGEVNGANGTGISKDPNHHAMGKKGENTFAGYSGTAFEPHDDYKGDFARTFMYMVARYRNNVLNNSDGAIMFVANKTNFTDYTRDLLMKWHRADPVSQKEIDRNQAVYGIQNNRNPFIDYPEFAEYIWGNRIGQTIDLSTMVPTCEGGGYDPGQATKYGVTWSANGLALYTDSVVAGRVVTALPDTPLSCSPTSDTFIGWTTSPIANTTDETPEVLYRTADAIPAITADISFYAVFAQAIQSEVVEPATYRYDEEHQDGWTNNATFTTYWLLDKDKQLVSPEVDLAGLSSIEINMRTYGGNQYCNLDVKAGDTQIATIVATNGKTLTDYTWTNTALLSGRSQLTFSTNYGASQGVGFTRVVINATGAGTIYSAFMTSCAGSEDMENNEVLVPIRKFVCSGQLLIQVGDQIYTVTGKKVQ